MEIYINRNEPKIDINYAKSVRSFEMYDKEKIERK